MAIEKAEDKTVIRVSVLIREAINVLAKKSGVTQDAALLELLEAHEPEVLKKAEQRAKLWQQLKAEKW